MKEIILIIIILTTIVGGGIYVQKYLNNSTEKLVKDLTHIKTMVEESQDLKKLEDEYDKIHEEWEKEKEKWSVIVLHDAIDEIEGYFINIKSAIECNDKDEAIAKIDVAMVAIKHIKEKEELSLINIL